MKMATNFKKHLIVYAFLELIIGLLHLSFRERERERESKEK